ncbi:hypothetical protein WN944_010406 [Citrus x changshan-huyou]|uniref:Uncharacterized protein n=1 Tax=Citrus x changshan-huyou TaxID=2935761 RepID=A0AAP0MU16_9ROSI
MDRNEILAKLHNRFPSLPQNALLTIYKPRSECMRLLMRNNIPADIRWLIETKVQVAEGVQAVSGRKTRGRCEPQSQLPKLFLFRGSQVLGIIPRALKPLGSLSDSPTGEELVVLAKKLFICAHTVNELLDLLQAYRPEPEPRTLVLESPNNDGNSSRSKKYKLDLTLHL